MKDKEETYELVLDKAIRADFIYWKIIKFLVATNLVANVKANPKEKIPLLAFQSFLMEIDEILSMKFSKKYHL